MSEPSITVVIATRNPHKTEEIRAILSDRFDYRTLNDFPGAPAVVEDAPTFAGNAAKKAVELAQWLAAAHGSIQPSLSMNQEIKRTASPLTPARGGFVSRRGFARSPLRGEGDAKRGAAPLATAGNPSPGPETCRLYVLADDSGLEVDALNGAPGVHSARFAALDRSADASSARTNSPDAANNAKLLLLLKSVPLEKRTARFRCVLALVEVTRDPALGAPHLFEGACEGRISLGPSGQGGFGYDPLFVPIGYEQSFAELGEAVKNKISHRARALEKLREWVGRVRREA